MAQVSEKWCSDESLIDSDGSLRQNTLPPHLDAKSSTIVKVNIYLRSINDIDDYKMVRPVRLKNGRSKETKKLSFIPGVFCAVDVQRAMERREA